MKTFLRCITLIVCIALICAAWIMSVQLECDARKESIIMQVKLQLAAMEQKEEPASPTRPRF